MGFKPRALVMSTLEGFVVSMLFMQEVHEMSSVAPKDDPEVGKWLLKTNGDNAAKVQGRSKRYALETKLVTAFREIER